MGTNPTIRLWREMGQSRTLVRQGSAYNRNLRIWVYLAEFRCPTEVSSGSPSFVLLPLNHSLFEIVGLSIGEKHFIQGGIAQDIRTDGRKRLTYHPLVGETGVIAQANGSARVKIGRTKVIVSVKRGKELLGKEALFVILGLTRVIDNDEKLDKFVKTHVSRLLKMDMVAVLNNLECQEEVQLAVKVYPFPLYSIILIT
ncbi:thylakoid assembly 8-like protein, chloroplastic [Tanacetum coccineum]